MSPPDPPRPRTFTQPPLPPSDIPSRVWVLERDLGEIKDELHSQTISLDDIKSTLTVIKTERSGEEKSRERNMKIITGIAVGVSVASLGTFAGWVIHLQTAMSAIGK